MWKDPALPVDEDPLPAIEPAYVAMTIESKFRVESDIVILPVLPDVPPVTLFNT